MTEWLSDPSDPSDLSDPSDPSDRVTRVTWVTKWPSDRVTKWQEASQTIDRMVYYYIIIIITFTRWRQTCRRWTQPPGRGCPRQGSTACPWSAGPVCTPGRPPGPGCRSSGGTAAWAALSLDYQYLVLSKCFVVCLQHLGNCNWYKQVYFDAVVLNININLQTQNIKVLSW